MRSVALVLLFLTGCLTLAGHDFDFVAASSMRPGTVTRAEAERQLGAPSSRNEGRDGSSTLVWTLERVDAAGKPGTKRVALVFGADGALRDPPKVWAEGIDAPLLEKVAPTAVVEKPRSLGAPVTPVALIALAREAEPGCFGRALRTPPSPRAWGTPKAQFVVAEDGTASSFSFVDVQPPPAIASAIESAVLACRWKPRAAGDPRPHDPVYVPVTFDSPHSDDWVDLELAQPPTEVAAGCMAAQFPSEHRRGFITQATILVRFLVNEKGNPEQFQIFPDFVTAAHRDRIVTALSRCPFRPGRNAEGKPLPVWSSRLFDVLM